MPFWESDEAHGAFVAHFTKVPARDFGVYARGYAAAARTLADSVLQHGFADYQVYPTVFLYRHALELYLKCFIVKGVHLAALSGQRVVERISYNHDLAVLVRAAASVLRKNFPGDSSLEVLLARLEAVVADFVALDGSSFVFRYPVDTKGCRPVPSAIHANLARLAETMNNLLDELDALEFGLDVSTDQAQELLEIIAATDVVH